MKLQQAQEKLLRTRCRRWVSSITRADRYTFTLLLSADFSWFYWKVKGRIGDETMDYKDCVEKATIDELRKLFHSIEEYRMEKILERRR